MGTRFIVYILFKDVLLLRGKGGFDYGPGGRELLAAGARSSLALAAVGWDQHILRTMTAGLSSIPGAATVVVVDWGSCNDTKDGQNLSHSTWRA